MYIQIKHNKADCIYIWTGHICSFRTCYCQTHCLHHESQSCKEQLLPKLLQFRRAFSSLKTTKSHHFCPGFCLIKHTSRQNISRRESLFSLPRIHRCFLECKYSAYIYLPKKVDSGELLIVLEQLGVLLVFNYFKHRYFKLNQRPKQIQQLSIS